MTREEILKEYDVNQHGIIKTPGKFEGEMLYVPYFWDAYLNGMADSDEEEILGFEVTEEDRAMFPELIDQTQVLLHVRDDGFVCEQ